MYTLFLILFFFPLSYVQRDNRSLTIVVIQRQNRLFYEIRHEFEMNRLIIQPLKMSCDRYQTDIKLILDIIQKKFRDQITYSEDFEFISNMSDTLNLSCIYFRCKETCYISTLNKFNVNQNTLLIRLTFAPEKSILRKRYQIDACLFLKKKEKKINLTNRSSNCIKFQKTGQRNSARNYQRTWSK